MNASLDFGFWSALLTTLTLQVACVVAATAGICYLIRSPQWRRTFWRVCAVSLVLLTAGELTGIGAGLVEWTASRVSSPGVGTVVREAAGAGAETDAVIRTFDAPAIERRSAPESPSSVLWPGIVWLAGLGAVLLRSGLARILCLRIRLRNRRAPASTIEGVDSLVRAMGMKRRIRILESPSLKGPIAFGLLKPTIVLPERFASDFKREQRQAMLAHELAHLANRDPQWHLLADIATALLWWHPLAWWARYNLRVVEERCADEASAVVPDGPAALAESLVLLGGRISRTEAAAGLGVGGGYRSNLGRRVECLLNEQGRRIAWNPLGSLRRLLAGTAAGALLLGVAFGEGFLTGGTVVAASEPVPLGESIRSSWKRSVLTLAVTSGRSTPAAVEMVGETSRTPLRPSGNRSGESTAEGSADREESAPAVEVTARFMDVPDSGAIFEWLMEWLMSAGNEFKIAETETELTPYSGRFPEGASNAFVRQLTGTIISEDIEGDLRRVSRETETDLLSSPKVTVLSGRGASIGQGQKDSEGIMVGVVNDVTPVYEADRDVIRLTLTATVTESLDVAPGADPEYRVRQVKLDDYEVPAGQTVVMGGFVDRDVSRGVKGLFVFVTPEVVEPPPDEADSAP